MKTHSNFSIVRKNQYIRKQGARNVNLIAN